MSGRFSYAVNYSCVRMVPSNPVKLFYDYYFNVWNSIDPRADGLMFMSSMKPLLFFLCLSFAIVVFGSNYLRNRRPLNVRSLMACYNVFIVLFNLYIGFKLLAVGYHNNYNVFCELPEQNNTSDDEMKMVHTMHLFHISKLAELIDTSGMVALKKPFMLSGSVFLHHTITIIGSWYMVRCYPTGSVYFVAMVNAFAHSLIYLYFGLTVFLPKVGKTPVVQRMALIVFNLQFFVIFAYAVIYTWMQCPVAIELANLGVGCFLCTIAFYGINLLRQRKMPMISALSAIVKDE